MAINPLLTDKRIQRQAIAQGLLTPEELEAHLSSLPDRSDRVQSSKSDDGGDVPGGQAP